MVQVEAVARQIREPVAVVVVPAPWEPLPLPMATVGAEGQGYRAILPGPISGMLVVVAVRGRLPELVAAVSVATVVTILPEAQEQPIAAVVVAAAVELTWQTAPAATVAPGWSF